MMHKTWLYFFPLSALFYFFLFDANGQSNSSANSWSAYVDSLGMTSDGTLEKKTPLYLVKFKFPYQKNYLQNKGVRVVRKLDESNAIIHYDKNISLKDRQELFIEESTANNKWKFSPTLLKQTSNPNFSPSTPTYYSITVSNWEAFINEIVQHSHTIKIKAEYKEANALIIESTYSNLENYILPLEWVTFIDKAPSTPQQESPLLDMNLMVNKINLVHHQSPELNGKNITVSVREPVFDTEDIDLKGRVIPSDLEGSTISGHATDMATVIAGGGNSSVKSKGVAWGANLTSSNNATPENTTKFPDSDSDYQRLQISVQNHSYGNLVESYYGNLAQAFDVSANNNPNLLHVFSAGNSGEEIVEMGAYQGIEGFSNLTGNYKMAKNILTVGSVNTTGVPAEQVSKGPAYDGRVKPELVAYSTSGSSTSAAIVSGTVTLLQEAYKLDNEQSLPPSALVKAILINSAEDVGPEGLDYFSGYGNINASKALQTINEKSFFKGSVNQRETDSFQLHVPPKAVNLKITLVWNDPAAAPNSSTALINDLDLELQNNISSISWEPWVLNHYPHPDSLKQAPKRQADHLNNIEQITISDPEEGDYTLTVKGFDIPSGPQDYFIAFQWEEENSFKWTFPTGSDNMPYDGESISQFRWETTFNQNMGKLELSLDEGETWETINENIDLSDGLFQWEAPEVFSIAIAKMTIMEKEYLTEPFTISRPINFAIGFNCSDSVMINWDRIPNVEAYTLYTLGEKYLEEIPLPNPNDTSIVLNKSNFTTPFFSVAPEIKHKKKGIRSLTFDYDLQGVECYVVSFLVDVLPEEGVELTLNLGTDYQVDAIEFERRNGNHFSTIERLNPNNHSTIKYLDSQPNEGHNEYRAKVSFKNQEEILTSPVLAYYFKETSILIFPNPVKQMGILNIYKKESLEETIHFQLFNANGRMVYEKELRFEKEELPLPYLKRGIYFYSLYSNKIRESGKIIIL
ncbi:S8 family serine peptidase [Xanthovirga aplysinae]|uniref:S8 family serine peptidase n=1 Tax=Xanthovirga aplysinae TaxID=2529853 RepID=UPI0012BB8EBC|nr:S8 family serine peptidase [Xanthovirga aplysinae]MTI29926.1 T9SS type A sorting domain-containing protein [Xanthovirga aplysinae]